MIKILTLNIMLHGIALINNKKMRLVTFTNKLRKSDITRCGLVFPIYHQQDQIGFGRVISDFSTFAYIADVYVLDQHRGHGLGKHLVTCITQHAQLQGLKRWLLVTADAHGLYEPYGFSPLTSPERFMENLASQQ